MGCIIGAALSVILGILNKIAAIIAKIFNKIFAYFGLWLPALFLLGILAINLYTGKDLRESAAGGAFFSFGMLVCIGFSIYTTMRHLMPKNNDKTGGRGHGGGRRHNKPRDEQGRDGPSRDRRVSRISDDDCQKQKNQPVLLIETERPSIYRSRKSPNLIIYEYENRFEVYAKYKGRLLLKSIEYKD
jgi:hypothetical protein